MMRAAYADPTYLGLATRFYSALHENAAAFCYWLFEVLNLQPEDQFEDLFPGSGAVSVAWNKWQQRSVPEQFALQV